MFGASEKRLWPRDWKADTALPETDLLPGEFRIDPTHRTAPSWVERFAMLSPPLVPRIRLPLNVQSMTTSFPVLSIPLPLPPLNAPKGRATETTFPVSVQFAMVSVPLLAIAPP